MCFHRQGVGKTNSLLAPQKREGYIKFFRLLCPSLQMLLGLELRDRGLALREKLRPSQGHVWLGRGQHGQDRGVGSRICKEDLAEAPSAPGNSAQAPELLPSPHTGSCSKTPLSSQGLWSACGRPGTAEAGSSDSGCTWISEPGFHPTGSQYLQNPEKGNKGQMELSVLLAFCQDLLF